MKQDYDDYLVAKVGSPPSRGRGLKHAQVKQKTVKAQVASFAGAWIETFTGGGNGVSGYVASFAGAWIETINPRFPQSAG